MTSDTSLAALHSIKPKSSTIREQILGAIKSHNIDGLTCDEIEKVLNLTHQTASARVRELRQGGKIVDSGDRRKTRSGRNAIVWRVTQDDK